MDSSDIAPMIVLVTLILTTGGVILLRPLTRRLADYLQVLIKLKSAPPPELDDRLREQLSNLETRFALLEERQSFMEALLSSQVQGRRETPEIAESSRSRD